MRRRPRRARHRALVAEELVAREILLFQADVDALRSCHVQDLNDPPRSLSFTCAGAVPSFLNWTVAVEVWPSTCVFVIDVGVTTRWPAASLKSCRTVPFAATLTVCVDGEYRALLAVNGCDPVRDENSQ